MVQRENIASSSSGIWPCTNDLNAFNSDCEEASCAMAVLMANLFGYDSAVISEVPISETIHDNDFFDNCVQEMYHSEQTIFDLTSDIEFTSDSNIISYDQYLKETESAAIQNTTSIEQQNVVIMSIFEEIPNLVAKCNVESIQNKNLNKSLTTELERYKERVNCLKKGKRKHDVIYVVDLEETLTLAEKSR
nr:hypothetical protein [Tanacetum cinerariifolium]